MTNIRNPPPGQILRQQTVEQQQANAPTPRESAEAPSGPDAFESAASAAPPTALPAETTGSGSSVLAARLSNVTGEYRTRSFTAKNASAIFTQESSVRPHNGEIEFKIPIEANNELIAALEQGEKLQLLAPWGVSEGAGATVKMIRTDDTISLTAEGLGPAFTSSAHPPILHSVDVDGDIKDVFYMKTESFAIDHTPAQIAIWEDSLKVAKRNRDHCAGELSADTLSPTDRADLQSTFEAFEKQVALYENNIATYVHRSELPGLGQENTSD